jgi:hypothetical protein
MLPNNFKSSPKEKSGKNLAELRTYIIWYPHDFGGGIWMIKCTP